MEIPADALTEAERFRKADPRPPGDHLMMGRPMYYDRQGRPIDMWLFGALHQRMDYKRVAETTIGPFWVSTVWLGNDYNFAMVGPPVIFETMVFANDDLAAQFELVRYCTEEAAAAGHEETCARVQAELDRLHRAADEARSKEDADG